MSVAGGRHGDLFRLRFGDTPPAVDDPDVLWVDRSTDPPILRVYRDGQWVPSGAALGDGLRRTGTLVEVLAAPGGAILVGPDGLAVVPAPGEGLVLGAAGLGIDEAYIAALWPLPVPLGGTGATTPQAARQALGALPQAPATEAGWDVRRDGVGKRHWYRQALVTGGWPNGTDFMNMATLPLPPSAPTLGAVFVQYAARANVNVRLMVIGYVGTAATTSLSFNGNIPTGGHWNALGLTEVAIDVELIEK